MNTERGTVALAVTGTIALGWFALNLPSMGGEFGPLAVILVGPYGLVGLVVLAGAWGQRNGRRWGRSTGIAGSVAALIWAGIDALVIHQWLSMLVSAITDQGVWYNWARAELWVPLAVLLGAAVATVQLTRRSPSHLGPPA